MNNKMSKIFQNNDIKNKTNNTYTYGNKNIQIKKNDIEKQIKNIFNSKRHIYGINVEITKNNKIENKIIIAKTKEYLITKENKKIYIKDIQNIVEK